MALRVGITLGQRRPQFAIVSVDVIAEMNFAVLIGERRRVHDEERDWLRETHGDIILSVLHSLLYSLQGPAGILAQSPRGQFGGFLDANTAVAEITARARECGLRGRAGKI